jgi:hypothetical protein
MGVRVKSGTKPFAGKKISYRFFRIFSSDLGIVFRKGENDVFNDIKNRKGVALGIPAVGTYPTELIRAALQLQVLMPVQILQEWSTLISGE